MASTFSQIKSALDAISDRLSVDHQKMANAKTLADDVAADITKMGTDYAQLFSDIDSLAAANPSNAAYTQAKAQKDQLYAEGGALKTVANNASAAITA